MAKKITMTSAVTRQEKDAIVQQAVNNFDRAGQLFLRDGNLYHQPFTEQHINKIIKQLCMWLGVKPRVLKLKMQHIDTASYQFEITEDETYILYLDPCVIIYPYLCVGLLARACSEYFLYRKGYIQPKSIRAHNEIVDLATVHLGFGVIMLNSFALTEDEQRFLIPRKISLPATRHLETDNYIKELLKFTRKYSIPPKKFIGHLLSSVRVQLVNKTGNPPQVVTQASHVTQTERLHARAKAIALISAVTIIGLLVALMAVIVASA